MCSLTDQTTPWVGPGSGRGPNPRGAGLSPGRRFERGLDEEKRYPTHLATGNGEGLLARHVGIDGRSHTCANCLETWIYSTYPCICGRYNKREQAAQTRYQRVHTSIHSCMALRTSDMRAHTGARVLICTISKHVISHSSYLMKC